MTETTTRIRLTLNGEPHETGARTLDELLVEAGFGGPLKVATAVNGGFVPATRRRETKLSAGDHIEVVAPRQGG